MSGADRAAGTRDPRPATRDPRDDDRQALRHRRPQTLADLPDPTGLRPPLGCPATVAG